MSFKPAIPQIIKVDLIVYNTVVYSYPTSSLVLQSELKYLAFPKIRIGDEGATYRWTSIPGCPSEDCVVPAGETWILDANMDVREAEKQSHL